jgi:hypothetical protein
MGVVFVHFNKKWSLQEVKATQRLVYLQGFVEIPHILGSDTFGSILAGAHKGCRKSCVRLSIFMGGWVLASQTFTLCC